MARTRVAKVFHTTVSSYLRALSPTSRRFWLLVPIVGALAGIAAVGSVHLLELLERLAWGGPHESGSLLEATRAVSPIRRFVVPLVGGLLLVAVSLVQRGDGGHGTSAVLEAIWVRGGRVRLRRALPSALFTLVAVSLGASLGREGALLLFGGAAGSALARRLRLTPDQHKVLVAAGAAAGIAAAYNTPIGAALFGLEILLGGLALELLGPLVFASITATLISRALLFDHPSYQIPVYGLVRPREILVYLVLGAVVGVLAAALVSTVDAANRVAARIPRRARPLLPLAAMLLVGAVGVFYPELFGNGYYTVNDALIERVPLGLLLALPVLKLLLSSVCSGFRVPGGLFTPTLFIGGLFGGAFGVVAARLFPHTVGPSGGYVLVGMAAALAGSTHASLAAAILLFELTGNYSLILPLLGASVHRCRPVLTTTVLPRSHVLSSGTRVPSSIAAFFASMLVVASMASQPAAVPTIMIIHSILVTFVCLAFRMGDRLERRRWSVRRAAL
jgi:CIC family chloride channel protein